MRSLILVLLIVFTSHTAGWTQSSKNVYQYTVDITRVKDDKVFVELITPAVSGKDITFYFPKIVPGTYSIADYGRFVSNLEATDDKGKKLPVEQVDVNSWKIKKANKLKKISYWVDDTYDATIEGPDIFWPAGTNIEEGSNFVINASGFFGYFEKMKETPFRFNIIRPADFYGSTGLIPVQANASLSSVKLENYTPDKNKKVDTYQTEDYDQLIDSPLMYCKPDTAVIKVANTEVLIGSYSPNNRITADEIAQSIREVLMAQKEFLGGKLPVDKYAFIFHFTTQPISSYGALEHSYSSFYFMPEAPIDAMNQQLRDFAAHEFFHIVTPLTVHSKEIEDFNFNDPKMSQHLWMYEGVTEYFAMTVQVKHELITPDQYLEELQEKMITADQFLDTVPFTEISKYTLEKYEDQYYNVYCKGSLIGLCLDLKLLKLSGGKYGLRDLMLDLSKKYGKSKAFDDNELFSIITAMTYPEIGEFFNRYVKGKESLPIKDVLQSVGVTYIDEEKYLNYSLGLGNENVNVTEVNNKPYLYITEAEDMNDMGKALGFKSGDVLLKINGETIPDLGPEVGTFIQRQQASLSERDTLTFTVLRKDEAGELKETELAAKVQMVELTQKHILFFDKDASEKQLALRQSWLED